MNEDSVRFFLEACGVSLLNFSTNEAGPQLYRTSSKLIGIVR